MKSILSKAQKLEAFLSMNVPEVALDQMKVLEGLRPTPTRQAMIIQCQCHYDRRTKHDQA